MSNLNITSIIFLGFEVILISLYLIRYRHHASEVFEPEAAWILACIYFCSCYLVAILTGVVETLFSFPISTPEQTSNPSWWAWVIGCVILVTIAYWVIWARYTLRFDRRVDIIPQTIFGLMWGAASGSLFLAIYLVATVIGRTWAAWQVFILAYVSIAIWQWLWQDYIWDVYIAPEHDSPWSIRFKVFATHIPNITVCLIFYSIYENHLIFIALQTWALVGASLAMRMPAPWSQDITPSPTRSKGLFGLARASGYISDYPENDPYMRAAHLTR
jgi:hypothetical protein